MGKRAWVRGLAGLMAFAGAGCSGAPPSEEVQTETSAATPAPDFLWWNAFTGQLSAWQLSGSTVTGSVSLDARCGPSDCGNTWFPFGTTVWPQGWPQIWWFDRLGTGQVASWTSTATGHVTYNPSLSWTCDVPSCSSQWKPIGYGILAPGTCQGPGVCINYPVVFWHNQWTDQDSLWLLADDNKTVYTSKLLSTTCGAAEGCGLGGPTAPKLTADFDGDGNTDLLWWNAYTGTLTVWLLQDSNGTVKAKQTLSSTLDPSTGWNIIGAADANGDRHADILWEHMPDGQITNWLLDGQGNVIGTPTLSWSCGADCNNAGWQPVGYVGLF